MPSTYSQRLRDDHRRGQMTFNVPPALGQQRQGSGRGAPSEHTPGIQKAAKYGPRDHVARIGAMSALDSSNRVAAPRAIEALGWTPNTDLVVEYDNGTALVRARTEDNLDRLLPATYVDVAGRLRLPPETRRALELQAGDQVVATAIPTHGELHLAAAVDVLQHHTGSRTPIAPVAHLEAPRAEPPSAPKTRVRRARYSA